MLAVVVVVQGLLAAQVAIPPDWTCDDVFFGDGVCDCGCSADDLDCVSDDASECARDGCGDLEPRDGDPKNCGPEPEDDAPPDPSGCPVGGLAAVFPLLLRRRRR